MSRLVVVPLALLTLVLASWGIGSAADASAGSVTMPRILLKGGAAEVGFTYTATPDSTPAGVSIGWQWLRGAPGATSDAFVVIPGATHAAYTLTAADHGQTVKATMTAYDAGRVVGERSSASSNRILYALTPITFTGVPLVGHTLAAHLGPWADEWDTTLTWRRDMTAISGQQARTYKLVAADGGTGLSLLAVAEYTYPNGVHPIDRRATFLRIRWGTSLRFTATSPARHTVSLTTGLAVTGLKQHIAPVVRIYDGTHLLRKVRLSARRAAVRLTGLSSGKHALRCVFVSTTLLAGASTTHTVTVR